MGTGARDITDGVVQPDARIEDVEYLRAYILERYSAASNSQDAEQYAELFHENALWCPPAIPDKRGKKAIRYGYSAKDARITVVTFVDDVEVDCDLGFVVGCAHVGLFPNDGGPKRDLLFRVFWIFKKIGGEWKIANQLWNEKIRP